tara:strand:- start:93 stop:311 length:219 start_codon:yes stop_codon:yes gene_type:complete
MKERALSFFCLSFSLEVKAAKRSIMNCVEGKTSFLFVEFFQQFFVQMPECKSNKKKRLDLFFPPSNTSSETT